MNIVTDSNLIIDDIVQYDEHCKSFRWYWFRKGVNIRRNGQIFDNRGNRYYDESYEKIAKYYANR